MDRNLYYVGIAFFGMVNGLFNQLWLFFALIYAQQLAGPLFFGSVGLTLMFASLMVSTATVILGGIPAAIYERRHRQLSQDRPVGHAFVNARFLRRLTLPAGRRRP
jgi:hypothetical protein